MTNVLIVEDEQAIRRFLRAALEGDGLRVYEAETLQRGLLEAATRKPDLIILDLGLPDGDGIDFIRDLRQWSAIPVIVLSARSEESDKIAALDAAWVSEFLPLLPQGVDTPLGNHASRLSVGQAQRVAVARALLNPCQLLLLDEPAASLDAHSEQRVMQALKAASKRQTTLMVTHQLEDLADWDAIWVMQDGAIVEQGSYAELSAANGAFATLLAHRQEDI